MARSATAQRNSRGRTRKLDRSATRHIATTPTPPTDISADAHGDEPPVPSPSQNVEESFVVIDTPWALLPTTEQEQFGLRISRLILKAVRVRSFVIEETPS